MEEKREIKKEENQLSLLETVYTLIDFTKYPIFVRSSTKDKRKQYTYQIDERDLDITMTITSPTRLPGLEEKKVWIWMMNKLSNYYKTTGEILESIPFTVYEILEFWEDNPKEGKRQKNVWEALETLYNVSIKLSVKNPSKNWEAEFKIIQSKVKAEIDKETRKFKKGLITLGKVYYEALKNRKLRPQCLQLWKEGIESGSVALSNLEELLEYYHACTGNNVISFSYDDLTKKLGLQKYNHLSKIKEKLGFIEKKGKEIGIIKRMEIREIIEQGEEKKKEKIFKVEFEIGDEIKRAVANNKINSDHKQLVGKIEEGEKLTTPDIDIELKFWFKEFKEQLREPHLPIEEAENLFRHIIQTYPNYRQLFYRVISETKQEQPENKIAYIIALLKKKIENKE
jgi:hypothetical protein